MAPRSVGESLEIIARKVSLGALSASESGRLPAASIIGAASGKPSIAVYARAS